MTTRAEDKDRDLKESGSGKYKCLTLHGVKLRGVHHFIEASYFPDGFTEKAFYAWLDTLKLKEDAETLATLRREHKTAVTRYSRGKLAGAKLQRELQAIANDPTFKPKLVETKVIMAQLADRKWTLERVELPVASERARVGTRVDMICRKPSRVVEVKGPNGSIEKKIVPGKLIVVENKRTTTHNKYRAFNKHLTGRFAGVPLSMQSLAHVQLLVTAMMYTRYTHTSADDIDGAYVMCVFATNIRSGITSLPGVWVEPLAPWALRVGVELEKFGAI